MKLALKGTKASTLAIAIERYVIETLIGDGEWATTQPTDMNGLLLQR